MLSFIASAIIATSAFATHEFPVYSGIRLDFSQGGDNWGELDSGSVENRCATRLTDMNHSPIDITRVTQAPEMTYKISGLDTWGKMYFPKSPAEDDPRHAAEPDFSMTVYTFDCDGCIPDSVPTNWATTTSLFLDAPYPLG